MFKRVERKRKRREEEEELGLDEDTKEIMGLNNTDSDESDSASEQESVQSDASGPDIGEDGDQEEEEDAASEDEGVNDDPPVSVAEALKDPIYLISLDPTVHGCVLCKGKLIKNAGMATTHRNANVHKRRFEQFKLLSAGADRRSNVWELVRAIRSAPNVHRIDSQELSKRALRRQVKQAAVREKRERHKELKAKAITKKALKKLSAAEETRPAAPSKPNLRPSPVSQNQPGKTRKKQKLESKTPASKTRDMTVKSASRTKASSDSKKSVLKSKIKSTRKANKAS